MYYYIFEPPQGPKEYERTAQIKEYLSQLGIAGEMAAPQPGRSTEDLVHLAISKRYSTVVAVGGMELVNRVARTLRSYDAVLGIIPTKEDADIEELIGTSEWKQAADQLKRRRWHLVRMGTMNSTICFLTPAQVHIPSKAVFSLSTDDFSLSAQGPATVVVTPRRDATSEALGLQVEFTTAPETKRGILSFFSAKSDVPRKSCFAANTVQLTTPTPLEIQVAGEVLSQTPVMYGTEPEAIKLITGRIATATVTQDPTH